MADQTFGAEFLDQVQESEFGCGCMDVAAQVLGFAGVEQLRTSMAEQRRPPAPGPQSAPPIAPAFGDGPARFVLRDGRSSVSFAPDGLQILTGPAPVRRGSRDNGSESEWGLRWSIDGAQAVEPIADGVRPDRV